VEGISLLPSLILHTFFLFLLSWKSYIEIAGNSSLKIWNRVFSVHIEIFRAWFVLMNCIFNFFSAFVSISSFLSLSWKNCLVMMELLLYLAGKFSLWNLESFSFSFSFPAHNWVNLFWFWFDELYFRFLQCFCSLSSLLFLSWKNCLILMNLMLYLAGIFYFRNLEIQFYPAHDWNSLRLFLVAERCIEISSVDLFSFFLSFFILEELPGNDGIAVIFGREFYHWIFETTDVPAHIEIFGLDSWCLSIC